ncbi:MAG: hypothetical protein AAF628_33420 [Planctomycetota bacterium]
MKRVVWGACGLALLAACADEGTATSGGSRAANVASEAPATPPGAGPATGALEQDTARLAAVLGAADWVPADASYFSSLVHLKDLWEEISESRAFRRLHGLLAVQMIAHEITTSEPARDLARWRRRSRLLDTGLELAVEAISREAFVYAGRELTDVMGAVMELVGETWAVNVHAELNGAPPQLGHTRLLEAVLRQAEDLRVPPIVVGGRIAAPERARAFLRDVAALVPRSAPFRVNQRALGGGEFYVVRLHPDLIPGWRYELQRELHGRVPAELVVELLDFLQAQRLTVALGLRDDYLLLSVGASEEHLADLGTTTSLAKREDLGGLRRRLRHGLLAFQYRSGALRGTETRLFAGLARGVGNLLGAAPAGETASRPDPRAEVRRFLTKLGTAKTRPPEASVTFRHDGLETFEFGIESGAGDASAPLELLRSATARPLLLAGSRAATVGDDFEQLAALLAAGRRLFEDTIVPTMNATEREDYQVFATNVAPLAEELAAITRGQLLPAIDGAETALLLDDGGPVPDLPWAPTSVTSQLRLPRLAMVAQLNDGEQFVEACGEYRAALNGFMRTFSQRQGVDLFEIPPMAQTRFAGGTLYRLPLPGDWPASLEPHALVRANRLILSMSREQTAALLDGTAPTPDPALVDFAAPANQAVWVDIPALTELLVKDLDVLARHDAKHASAASRKKIHLFLQHVKVVQQALGALRSYSTRTFHEGGVEVRHSWLHVEDA